MAIKIIVKENIGRLSELIFGSVGDEVKFDKYFRLWNNRHNWYDSNMWITRKQPSNQERLNDFYSKVDVLQTVFEVIDDEEKIWLNGKIPTDIKTGESLDEVWVLWKTRLFEEDIDKLNNYFKKLPDKYYQQFELKED